MLYKWGVAIFSLAPFTIRPSRSAWVRRTVLRHSTPALGGDLLLAVEAMTPVVVVVCQVSWATSSRRPLQLATWAGSGFTRRCLPAIRR